MPSFIFNSESENLGEVWEIQKVGYVKNGKNFLGKIKSIFNNF